MVLSGYDLDKRIKIEPNTSYVDSDLTDFPALVALKNTSVSGIQFDYSPVFNTLQPTDINDDFTGVSGTLPSNVLWNSKHSLEDASSDYSGTLKLYGDDSLYFATYSTATAAYVESKYKLSGDFYSRD